MTLVDVQQLRVLERLQQAGSEPVTFTELDVGGIRFPATVVSELELHGYAIERVYDQGRLVGVRLYPDPTNATARTQGRRSWPRRRSAGRA